MKTTDGESVTMTIKEYREELQRAFNKGYASGVADASNIVLSKSAKDALAELRGSK